VQYLRCTLVAAVRRIFEPGTKVDTILVLVGGQGFYKSTFYRVLTGPQWFSDSPIDLDNKDGMLTLHRAWFTELGEIDHVTSLKAAERIKGFASSCTDTFRPPFARSVAVFPRSCMIVGTTNRERFLNDPTGSRRFWPVKILQPIDIARLNEWRDQIWAEALNLFSHGVDHWLSPEHDALRADQSEGFECEDPWESQVDLAVEAMVRNGKHLSDGLSIAELMNMMSIPTTQQNRGASMKLAEILKQKGWTKKRSRFPGSRAWRWVPILGPTGPTMTQPISGG
jgi:predicted P-loop ATPase